MNEFFERRKEQKEGYMYGHFSPGGNFLLEKKII